MAERLIFSLSPPGDTPGCFRNLPARAAALFLAAAVCLGQPAAAQAPPNVVVLFADDLGYGDLSSYGNPTIRTANLDRLADEGLRFTSFYVSTPACSPSRAALLTGRYPLRAGLSHVVFPESDAGLPGSEITLAELLKGVGYRTMAVGKWHLGHNLDEYLPTSQGFDAYFGLPYSNDMIPPWVRTERPLRLYRDDQPIDKPVDQSRLTVWYTEEAVDFITRSGDEPFFLYLAYSMPHLPIHAPEEFRGKSDGGLYGDVVETIDWSAGRVLQALEEQEVAENTMVVFTSDNGPWSNMPDRMLHGGVRPWHAGSAGMLRGAKGTTYEGGVRVPAIIRWPGRIPAGHVIAEIATTMDLFTTLAAAAGAEIPVDRTMDGNDLLPFLRGTEPSPTVRFFYTLADRVEGVRHGAWKLRLRDEPELYNLDVDPGERHSRADDRTEITARLYEQMARFAEEIGAVVAPFGEH